MTYKQIEASREARLWIKDVIVPVAATVATVMCIPEVRTVATNKYHEVKDSIKSRIKKEK